jgi:amino acid transporter
LFDYISIMSNANDAHANTHHSKLGWFLCWAVVFADIGTSLYYVPGILYGDVNSLAGLFVILSSIVFVLLVLKYIEITARYPEGGGVVTVATNAFGPWFGALGGMFITVDYFLTASISAISGFAYLNSIVNLGGYIVIAAVIGVILLGVLNIIGISESAKVTAVVATLAFIVDIILVIFVSTQIGPDGWSLMFSNLQNGINSISSPVAILTGFAGSFLAFSGLESISQLSPAMQEPRKKVATMAMIFVVAAIFLTSPILTLFTTNLITTKIPGSQETVLEGVSKIKEREHELAKVDAELMTTNINSEEYSILTLEKTTLTKEITEGKEYSERFMSELGAQYGGTALKVAIVATASVLLLFAANTAIIGAYHVFMSLSRGNFLPHFMQNHNKKFGTPHIAVLCAVLPPVLIMIVTKGDVGLLGQLYAFGLLGAFGLSSVGLDVVRWKESKKVTPSFAIGVVTTVLVFVAWGTNLINKPLATIFGGGITIVGMILAFIVHKYFAHKVVDPEVEVEKVRDMEADQIFVPVYDEFDPSLFDFVASQAKVFNKDVNLMYIREFADVLQTVSESIEKDEDAAKFLEKAESILEKAGVKVESAYKATSDIAALINETRSRIKPVLTVISPHKKSSVVEFLRGDVLKSVINEADGNVLIYTGSNKK